MNKKALFEAILNNNLEAVNTILKGVQQLKDVNNHLTSLGINELFATDIDNFINSQDSDGSTFLFVASKKGHLEIATLLINAKADVNRPYQSGATPLFIASLDGHLEIVAQLLDVGAGIAANIPKLPLPIAIDFSNKVVIGLKMGMGGDLVTRKISGFKNAITNIDELKAAIKAYRGPENDIFVNRNALIAMCQFLVKKNSSNKTIKTLLTVLNYQFPPTSLKNICLNMLNQKNSPLYSTVRSDKEKFSHLSQKVFPGRLNPETEEKKGVIEEIKSFFSFKKN